MLDTTHQELLGRTFRELACPEDAEPERTFAQQLLDGDIPQYTIEKQFQNESGDVIVCRVTSNVISRRDGRPVYVLKLLENVTQQRRVQEMVRRQERLAAIGTLAAGIAHEINSPAGAALLSAETALTLLDRPGSEKDVRTCLENIVIASQRCGEIIRNTLRFSQDHKSEKALRDLNDVIRIAADLPRMIVDRTRSRVELQLEGDLPKVSINELELELIVVNLIKNALQANSRPVLVVIQTRRVDDRVEMVVADNGTGMSAYQQSRAFDPFYTTRRSAGGTGLGLSIVHGIVQDHGGTIEIESKLGEGAVFRILLPIRDTDDRQP